MADMLREIHGCSYVLEVAKTGLISNLKSFVFQQPLESFHMDEEEAFRWLCQSTYGRTADHAMQALRLCRYLAEKHGLDKPTHHELEAQATKNILGGYRGKFIFQSH
jgi:hypothetical protein